MIYDSFESFIESVIIPKHTANPTHSRLDGLDSGSNWDIAGTFLHQNKIWNIHADSRYEPLLLAHKLIKEGKTENPFIEENTASGKGKCLILQSEIQQLLSNPRKKYLYIYESTSSPSLFANHFLQYWKPAQIDHEMSLVPTLVHSGSDQLNRVKIGDVVWIVTVRNGELFVAGRMKVGEHITQAEAKRRLGQNVWQAKYHIVAEAGTEEDLREISLKDIADKLRFSSPTGKDRLVISKNYVDGKQLQTIRKLTPESVKLLELKWYGTEEPETLKIQQQISSGAGFGDPEKNKKVEKSAVQAVTEMYEKEGWKVESVEAKKCGYDLLCTKRNLKQNVEVKGVSGAEISFIITSNEVNQANTNPNFVICVVTLALSENPQINRFTANEFTKNFALEAIAYKAKLTN